MFSPDVRKTFIFLVFSQTLLFGYRDIYCEGIKQDIYPLASVLQDEGKKGRRSPFHDTIERKLKERCLSILDYCVDKPEYEKDVEFCIRAFAPWLIEKKGD